MDGFNCQAVEGIAQAMPWQADTLPGPEIQAGA